MLAGCLLPAPSVMAQTAPPPREAPIAEIASADGRGKVQVLSLKRQEGDLVMLRFRVDGASVTQANTRLIDLAGRRSYSVGLSGPGCSEDGSSVCWVMFGSPPRETRTIAVQFYGKFELLPGVPIAD